MITEVFVSLDGLNFSKLDLIKDESIPMRYTFVDTKDISKVFSPYSLNFTFDATANNLNSLGYFGNTDVIKSSDLRKVKAKVYVNSILNQTGLLKLEKIVYKMGKPSVITASFASNLTNLKDKIKDDTISMLGSLPINWNPAYVKSLLTGVQSNNIDGIPIKYFVPLASTNRVLQYNAEGAGLDNIFFNSANSPTSNNVLKASELRPAISFSTIVELIKEKYNLLIISPLENRTEYKDAFIWCTGETFGSKIESIFKIIANEIAVATLVNNFIRFLPVTNSVKITYYANRPFRDTVQTVRLEGINYLSGNSSDVTLRIFKIGQAFAIVTETFSLTELDHNLTVSIPSVFFDGNNNSEIEYTIDLKFSQPISWQLAILNTRIRFTLIDSLGPFIFPLTLQRSYNNFQEMGGSKIDLIKSLPSTKVIDFLTSFLKSFNIAILDVNPDDDSLYFYTPQDILANKKEVTYIADISNVEKTTQDDFNYYIFKHAESKYKSNVDYKIGAGQDYGLASFPVIKPPNAKEFQIETNFTIIPPVTIAGTNVTTVYGFESGQPEILDTGEARYKQNFNELVLFYSHGNKPLNVLFGVQSSLTSGILQTQSIGSYIQVLPYTTDNKSFAFSVLVNNNVAYRDTLFSRYYADIIARYIDQNVMKQDFTLELTANEVRDFRLENDVIIGENKFTIIDSTIDITTGKTKLTLLNY
jgi:hypothetical protein